MTEKITEQKNTTEILTPEQFLETLYNRIEKWGASKGLSQLTSFPAQRIPHWDESAGGLPRLPVPLRLDLEKAVILGDDKKILGISLGYGKFSRYNHVDLYRLEFGVGYRPNVRDNLDINVLKFLVQPYFGFNHGEFNYDPSLNRVNIRCWPDARMFGGKEIGRGYNRWPQEKILTEKGLKECLHLVTEIDRRMD